MPMNSGQKERRLSSQATCHDVWWAAIDFFKVKKGDMLHESTYFIGSFAGREADYGRGLWQA
jgi:hypothetical protein